MSSQFIPRTCTCGVHTLGSASTKLNLPAHSKDEPSSPAHSGGEGFAPPSSDGTIPTHQRELTMADTDYFANAASHVRETKALVTVISCPDCPESNKRTGACLVSATAKTTNLMTSNQLPVESRKTQLIALSSEVGFLRTRQRQGSAAPTAQLGSPFEITLPQWTPASSDPAHTRSCTPRGLKCRARR